MRKLSSICVLGALLAAAGSASANTIQPIFMSVTPLGGGEYSYVYDLQLTPNNGLSNNSSFPSSVTIVDFGVVSGTPTLSYGGGFMGADATSSGDWQVFTSATGAPSLLNASYVPITFTLSGSGNSATATDLSTFTNVTVKYMSSTGLTATSSQRSLVQLTVISNLAPGPVLQSLSMNTALGTINQADTFPVLTVVPVPAAAWAGLSMLGALGAMGFIRRRRLA